MAGRNRKRQTKTRTKGGWIALKIILALVIGIGALFGYAALNANIVHVRYAEVVLNDLPKAFDGCKLLFVSDVDMCGINSPEKSAKLMGRLQALKPDILLLGGDYTSTSIMEILNQTENNDRAMQNRRVFFNGIAGFEAPMGKYAVAGDNDKDLADLEILLKDTGIVPLFNGHAAVENDGQKMHIIGLNANSSDVNFNSIANAFNKNDCVIALAHTPAVFPKVITAEAKDSGNWADLVLAGHTHGGQIRLMDNNIIQLNNQELSFIYGWKKENEVLLLTSSGVGCEGANLRFGSKSEVWLITLSDGISELSDFIA